jgi:hypothetical protein
LGEAKFQKSQNFCEPKVLEHELVVLQIGEKDPIMMPHDRFCEKKNFGSEVEKLDFLVC